MTAENFEVSFDHMIKSEGGYVNNPFDKGGRTNWGVTQATWESWIRHPVGEKEMRELTIEDVRPLYKAQYWNLVRGDELPSGVDYAVFDVAVNSGVARAIRFLQLGLGIMADGVIGTITMKHAHAMPADDLIRAICQERREYLQRLGNFDKFGKGWLLRVGRVEKTALEMTDVNGTIS